MKSRFHRESGMTLIEQLVVLGIVGLALTVATAAVGTGALGLNISTSKNQAISLATAQMEYVKGHAYTPAPATYPPGVIVPAGYSLSTVAEAVPTADSNVQKVVVTVTRDGETVLTLEGLKVNRP